VATPIDWQELADKSLHPRRYTIKNIFRRLGQKEDPWKGMSRRAVPWETLCARLGRRRLDRRDSREEIKRAGGRRSVDPGRRRLRRGATTVGSATPIGD
jgi:DNA primase